MGSTCCITASNEPLEAPKARQVSLYDSVAEDPHSTTLELLYAKSLREYRNAWAPNNTQLAQSREAFSGLCYADYFFCESIEEEH